MQKQLRAGYYSAVTHTDRLFGNVMDALDGSGVADDTFVLVTGVRCRCFLDLAALAVARYSRNLESVGVRIMGGSWARRVSGASTPTTSWLCTCRS